MVSELADGVRAHPRPGVREKSRPGWQDRYLVGIGATDAAAALIGAGIAFAARFGEVSVHNQVYVIMLVVFPIGWVVALAMNGCYEARYLYVGTSEYQRVLHAGLWVTALVAIVSYAFELPTSRMFVLVALPVSIVASAVFRFGWRKWLHAMRATGRCVKRVVLIGHEVPVAALARQLGREHFHGLHVVGACLPTGRAEGPFLDIDARVYGGFDDAASAVSRLRADTAIVLSCPEWDGVELRRFAWRLERSDVDLILASALVDVAGARTTVRPVDGLPMLHVEHARLTGGSRLVKELFDKVVALALLVAFAPLLAVVMGLIRLTSDGPALFSQERVGKDGVPFTMWKFRSMYADAPQRLAELAERNESEILFKMRDDPRVTRVGRTLRRFSIDELPQLWNVVRGDMSLVGPRPPLPSEVEMYAVDVWRRLAVKPGLTGLWQISGRADLPWDEAVRLDLRYVEHWSLTLDLVILARTVTAVLRSSGAY